MRLLGRANWWPGGRKQPPGSGDAKPPKPKDPDLFRRVADYTNVDRSRHPHEQGLQMIFVSAALQVPDQNWFSNSEAYMRMALKAQSNCRATIETLAAIKNPSVVFARQANIAQGPQQVNNAMMPAPRAGAGKTEKRQNELSGGSNELLPDLRTPGAAIGSDPAMAAVAAFDRAKVRRR
jgi:hypothetical protein